MESSSSSSTTKEAVLIHTTEAQTLSTALDDTNRALLRLKDGLFNAVERYWIFELFGWTLAFGCFIGTVALLAVLDGKQSPTWTLSVGAGHYRKTFGLTINTIISIFATAFNSGLLIPTAACTSQLKFLWFQRGRRPLVHFQRFDSAARGPLGSIVLLCTLRFRRLACVGAVIIISALGIGFAFQALVVYSLQPVPAGKAEIQRTNVDQEYVTSKFLSLSSYLLDS